jgi:hypothetical protein
MYVFFDWEVYDDEIVPSDEISLSVHEEIREFYDARVDVLRDELRKITKIRHYPLLILTVNETGIAMTSQNIPGWLWQKIRACISPQDEAYIFGITQLKRLASNKDRLN